MAHSKRKGKNFIPPKRHNPTYLAHKIEKNGEEIQKIRKQKDMIYAALERHVEYLTNFTSHDIKNAIQNMDSVVSSLDIENVTNEDIETIKACLGSIRSSLQNFASLVPNSTKKEFYLKELCMATELINKPDFKKNKIKFESNYEKGDKTIITQPYHSLLQVLNNLMINSIKSFEGLDVEKRIRLDCHLKDGNVEISISDNGCGISDSIKPKIFDMYFSNTNGSGVGLYHATYILADLNGKIELLQNIGDFVTVFKISFPIITTNEIDTDN
ncbi:hypothetical protein GVN20_24575 [Runella sp. CRIBMP]|uniref:sensor histidine kinase n=1 Tax=Runella sp. CRIBMP TaxID=2683261 RepID=UPI0014133DBE|nr:HAMP domain-containing sensor histidine kinase [Runella sp. CRIBMP]NBB22552.1 hypothetical protein [Runella sp. CRIBMP]